MGIFNIPILIYPFFKKYQKYTHLQYTHYFENEGNIPICEIFILRTLINNFIVAISKN